LSTTRREFLKYLVEGATVLGFLDLLSLVPRAQTKNVRPPGAIEEAYFNIVCVRCGVCLEVCPTKAIVLAGFEDGVAAISTPKIDPVAGPCEFYLGRCEKTMRCSKYCPTGALQLVDRKQVKLGTVEFNSDLCLAYNGKECLICFEVCPACGAITAENLKPLFHGDICVGCGTCVNSCPAVPKALTLLPKGVKRVGWPR